MLDRKIRLSIDDLIAGEEWVQENLLKQFGWPLSRDVVEKELNLTIKEVDLGSDMEAKLIPDEKANGCIELNSRFIESGEFEYLHEVIHYVMDVGIGNKVDREFTRQRTDNGNDPHERIIDYRAAVALVPGSELISDIQYYKKHWFTTDGVKFLRDLQNKYSCSEDCIRKRFREVHSLLRSRKYSFN